MARQRKPGAGRPRKRASGEGLVPLGLHVPAEIKNRLGDAADRSGRSQSQEAAHRLSLTFEWDKGPGDLAQLLTILNLVQQVWGKSWRDDPDTRKALMGLCIAYFMRNAPEGFDPIPLQLFDFGPMLERIYEAIQIKGENEQ